jgi:hypothetical protein
MSALHWGKRFAGIRNRWALQAIKAAGALEADLEVI